MTDLIPLGVKSTLQGLCTNVPGHAERSENVVPKAGVDAPLGLQGIRDPRGASAQPGSALLPSREGDRREMCPGASGYQSSFSEDSRLHF